MSRWHISLLSAALLSAACSDPGVTVHNSGPGVAITSPGWAQELMEGAPLTVVATVRDDRTPLADLDLHLTTSQGGTLAFDSTLDEEHDQVTLLIAGGLAEGTQTLTLKAVDAGGAHGEDGVEVEVVRDTAPVAAFVDPEGGSIWPVGARIDVEVWFQDPDEDDLADLDLAWGGALAGMAELPAHPDAAGRVEFTIALDEPGEQALEVEATDRWGLCGTGAVTIEIVPRDEDGDGFARLEDGGDDCDDADPDIFPGADEWCNGVDDDCDGTIDEDDARDASTWFADADADGFGDPAATGAACTPPSGSVSDGTDCDDTAPAVFPGADEWCNGVDDDCDRTVDEDDALDAPAWFADADADGFGDPAVTGTACAPPSGSVPDGSDCDDADPDTFPGADEWCNGHDDDCDGTVDEDDALDAPTWFADADSDGYGDVGSLHAACAQPSGAVADATDCDDHDASIHPGATDDCADGIDADCDGLDATCRFGGAYTLQNSDVDGYFSGGTSSRAGSDVTFVPDLDGDGTDEILIGARDYSSGSRTGGAYLVYGSSSLGGALGGADLTFQGDVSSGRAGFAVAAPGDVDGDGFDDLAMVGQREGTSSGSAYLYVTFGPFGTGTSALSAADVRLSAASLGAYGEASLAAAGDVDGDGRGDLLAGWFAYGGTGSDSRGHAALLLGASAVVGAGSLLDADVTFIGEDSGDYLGRAVAGGGDVDGDGLDDLLIGATGWDAGTDSGAAFFFRGPPASGAITASTSTADATLWGTGAGDSTGGRLAMAGDVDGDGHGDVLIGATGAGTGGAAYLVYGDSAGLPSLDLGGADAIFSGSTTGDHAGADLAGVGDLDGDGLDDLMVAAYAATAGGYAGAGVSYLFYGPVSGSMSLTAADASFAGTVSGGNAGFSLAGGGDVDGDGWYDLLIGAYGESTAAGKVYLYLGGAL
ncbi:MAG: MopE-related protein [Pseudomonadota bacterium]